MLVVNQIIMKRNLRNGAKVVVNTSAESLRPSGGLTDQMRSLMKFFMKTSDLFFEDLKLICARHGIKLGEAGRFEVCVYMTQDLWLIGMVNEYPPAQLGDLVRFLMHISCLPLSNGGEQEPLNQYGQMFMQRFGLYTAVIGSRVEDADMEAETKNRLVDLLLLSGQGDVPKPISKQCDAHNDAILMAVVLVSAYARKYWAFGVQELFTKTTDIEAIPQAEFEQRLEKGIKKGKEAFEQMRGDLEKFCDDVNFN